MASNLVSITRRGFGETARRDLWWAQSLITFLVFGSFIVYSTWAAFQGEYYLYTGGGAHYLSPFYSPELLGSDPIPVGYLLGCRLRLLFLSSGHPADFGLPAITIGELITTHSGPTR